MKEFFFAPLKIRYKSDCVDVGMYLNREINLSVSPLISNRPSCEIKL